MNLRSLIAACFSIGCGFVACAFDADTIAFYTFNDAPAGTDADGCSITNSVDGTKYVGTATKGVNEFKFTDDRPAKYIFASASYGAELLAMDPGSLLMNSKVTNACRDNGTVLFPKLAEDICSGDFTVEFFYKYQGTTEAYSYGGYLIIPVMSGETTSKIIATSGLPHQGQSRVGIQVGDAAVSWGIIANYPASHDLRRDGKWHHLAVVYSKSNKNLVAYFDRELRYVIKNLDFQSAADAALTLGNNYLAGSATCLRVTKRALSKWELLFASDLPTCLPRTAVHLTLDGPLGEEAGSLTNVAPVKVSDCAPNAYWLTSYFDVGVLVPAGALPVPPQYVETLPQGRRYTLVDRGDGSGLVENGGGVSLTATAPAEGTAVMSGTGIELPDGSFLPPTGSFTLEMFVKFNHDDWFAKTNGVGNLQV